MTSTSNMVRTCSKLAKPPFRVRYVEGMISIAFTKSYCLKCAATEDSRSDLLFSVRLQGVVTVSGTKAMPTFTGNVSRGTWGVSTCGRPSGYRYCTTLLLR